MAESLLVAAWEILASLIYNPRAASLVPRPISKWPAALVVKGGVTSPHALPRRSSPEIAGDSHAPPKHPLHNLYPIVSSRFFS